MIEKKRILMVAKCNRRGKGPAAYIGELLTYLKKYGKQRFEIDLLVTSMNSGYNENDFDADNLFIPKSNQIGQLLLKIPRVRAWLWSIIIQKTFSKIVNVYSYDVIVFHAIPDNISQLVIMSKASKCKVLLYPWGSEIMRASDKTLNKYRVAFDKADYVRGDGTMLVSKLRDTYHVPEYKFVTLLYGSKVIDEISRNRGKYSKDELAKRIGLRKSSCYIVCGYSGAYGQCHEEIITQLALIKDKLPMGYELVFPFTYGVGPKVEYLKKLCVTKGLNAFFLTDYMTDEHISYLHLLTDLFIHVQKTDQANSYLMEAVYAGTQIVNGGWLTYPEIEDGGKPYHITPSMESLHETVEDYFCEKLPPKYASNKVIEEIGRGGWDNVVKSWVEFFL